VRWPQRLLAGLLAAAGLAAGGLWLWAGSEGSLASALTWVGARQPLQAEGVTGTLRGGGTVRRLVWSQDGLRVEADEAELRWRPAALLSRTLRIEQLSARRLLIDDQRPASTPPAGPPEALTLPLHVRVAALRVALRPVTVPGVGAAFVRPLTAGDVFDGDAARAALAAAGLPAGRKVDIAIGLAQTLCDDTGAPLLDASNADDIRALLALEWSAMRSLLDASGAEPTGADHAKNA